MDRVERGIDLFEQGDFEGAMRRLGAAMKKDIDDIKRCGADLVSFHKHGRYEEALACSDSGIKICQSVINAKGIPKYESKMISKTIALFARTGAIQLEELGRHEEALVRYMDAAKADPDDHTVCAKLGDMLEDLERLKEAEKWYERAARMDPTDFESRMGQARTLECMALPAKAASCYERAINALPEEERTIKVRLDRIGYADARIGKARVLLQSGKLSEALFILDDLIRIDSKYAPAHIWKGMLMRERGDMEKAIKCLDEAIRISEKAETYIAKAVCLKEMGMSKEAIKCYDSAICIGGATPEVLYEKAMLHLEAGERKRCMECLEESIRMDPIYENAVMEGARLLDEDKKAAG